MILSVILFRDEGGDVNVSECVEEAVIDLRPATAF